MVLQKRFLKSVSFELEVCLLVYVRLTGSYKLAIGLKVKGCLSFC